MKLKRVRITVEPVPQTHDRPGRQRTPFVLAPCAVKNRSGVVPPRACYGGIIGVTLFS
jgi:hypothetical protein